LSSLAKAVIANVSDGWSVLMRRESIKISFECICKCKNLELLYKDSSKNKIALFDYLICS